MAKVLYICYFGLREPLVQTQVIPYLLEIAKDGHSISLLTFEPDLKQKWSSDQVESERETLHTKGIDWKHLAYHKSPSVPATFYDIVNGTRSVRKWIAREKYDVLHCRVHVPALIGVLARKLSRRKPKILFDIRGFFPEEYTDAGLWPENGWLFKVAKRLDRWLMRESDAFVVLTEKARSLLFPESLESGTDKDNRPVAVIPCCVDLSRFETAADLRSGTRQTIGAGKRRVVAYVGSFGGWYLSDQLFEFLKIARESDPELFVLILTQRDKELVVSQLLATGFSPQDFYIESVPPNEIAGYLTAADFALSFIKPCYSKQASSPTKIAEYLAAGLPIVANRGVGDIDDLLKDDGVGILLDGLDTPSHAKAIHEIDLLLQDPDVVERCTESAVRRFDLLTVGGPRYRSLYRRLLAQV